MRRNPSPTSDKDDNTPGADPQSDYRVYHFAAGELKGEGCELAADLDRAMFRAHPELTRYMREPIEGEFADVIPTDNLACVEVVLIGPGVRARIPYTQAGRTAADGPKAPKGASRGH